MSLAKPAAAKPEIPEPKILGESLYDRVTSMLMAVVAGAFLVVAWLGLIYMTSQAYASRVSAPLEIVEVYGGGGGSPDGEVGSTETINVPGAEAGESASNNEVDAAEFEAPSVENTPTAMLDAAANVGGTMAEVDIGESMPNGGAVASGKRASRIGSGKIGFGNGSGDGGVRREDRWSIIYNPGQTADEYARQVDALGVELATINGPETLIYGSHFSSPTPTTRIGPAQVDGRLYFAWQGQGRKASDVALLQKAGIDVGEKPILQFYPQGIEAILSQLEVAYKGRQPIEIRVTRFRVVPKGTTYGFEVIDQQTVR
jgi:hypothetical protein